MPGDHARGQPCPPPGPVRMGSVADRLATAADMLCTVVGLLNETMDEIKDERGHKDDDSDAASQPDRNP